MVVWILFFGFFEFLFVLIWFEFIELVFGLLLFKFLWLRFLDDDDDLFDLFFLLICLDLKFFSKWRVLRRYRRVKDNDRFGFKLLLRIEFIFLLEFLFLFFKELFFIMVCCFYFFCSMIWILIFDLCIEVLLRVIR